MLNKSLISEIRFLKHDMEGKPIENKKVDEEISLKELISKLQEWYGYLLSRWAIIMAFGVMGGVLGLTYSLFRKPIYTAVTTFVLEDGDNGSVGLGQYAGLASMVGVDLGGGGGGIFQGDNILALYKSRSMIEKTLLTDVEYLGNKKLLVDHYIDFTEMRNKWAKKPELKGIQFRTKSTFTRMQDSILGVIVNDINSNYLSVAKPNKKLSIIEIGVKAHDEFFAKAFNEQIVKNVNDFYIQTKTKKALENVAILQQKTDSVRSVMNNAIYNVAIVSDATPNLNPTRQVQRTAPVQRSQFSAETNKEILGELVKNLEMSKIAFRKEMPLIQVIDKPIFPLEIDRVGKLKGIVLGGVLLGFLSVLFLSLRKIIYDGLNI